MPKLSELRQSLVAGGPRIAPEDFIVLAAHATHTSASELLAHPERMLSAEAAHSLEALVSRRSQGEPVAYLIGSKEFYGRRFQVSPSVLIPRPETELLVEEALAAAERILAEGAALTCIDIGTGSGAIIATLAAELHARFPEEPARFVASDASADALATARQNASRLIPEIPIEFRASDLLRDPSFDSILSGNAPVLISANLPYLSEALYASSMPDVRDFEPKEALVSGLDGLDHYRRLLSGLGAAEAPIFLFLEMSPEQESSLTELARGHFPSGKHRVIPDLAGLPRVYALETQPAAE